MRSRLKWFGCAETESRTTGEESRCSERKGKGDDDLDFNGRVECRFRRIWTGMEKKRER